MWLTALKDKESTSTAAVFSTWLDFNGLCRIVQCDNSTEFKGALRQKCLKYGIKVINGRAYHPETQGSVERANGIYKQRLRAYIMETGGNNWVESLGDITRVINTTPCSVLPRHTTPYEVFFGHKPRFCRYNPSQSLEDSSVSCAASNPSSDESEELEELEETDKDLTTIFTALEQRVFQKNTKVNAGYAKRGGISKTHFEIGDIVTLAVEKIRRVVGEPLRLPCRIIGIEGGKYSLLSAIGWLSGWYTGNQLNETRGAMVSANIPYSPLGEKRMSLSAAFKQLYDRPSINALQGKGKAKKTDTANIRNRRPAIAASSMMATETEEAEQTLDMIEVEETEALDTMETGGELTEGETAAPELAEEVAACITRETAQGGQLRQQQTAQKSGYRVRVGEQPITPCHRRKRARYSPSPI